jgi:hypothetical protein
MKVSSGMLFILFTQVAPFLTTYVHFLVAEHLESEKDMLHEDKMHM